MQLIEAAKEGNLDVVKQLVSKGVKVDCQDRVHIALLFSCLCAGNRLIHPFHPAHLLLHVLHHVIYVQFLFFHPLYFPLLLLLLVVLGGGGIVVAGWQYGHASGCLLR